MSHHRVPDPPQWFFVHEGEGAIVARCADAMRAAGWIETSLLEVSHVAIAPCLRRKLSAAELAAPIHGTLIFHPSLLPRHRGPDAIKHQVALGARWGGVTWFWADEGWDTGPICEQELLAYPAGLRPRELYETIMVPAGVRCLERAAAAIRSGFVRRVPQDAAAATYEGKFVKAEVPT